MSECPLCEGEGQVVQGISIYAQDHMYPEIVTCPDCDGTGVYEPFPGLVATPPDEELPKAQHGQEDTSAPIPPEAV